MRFSLIFSFAFFCSFIANGQRPFPVVETETIEGRVVEVPSEFSGKHALIGVGTSKKAEDDLRTWQIPIYNRFIAKTGLMDDMYDVEVCFLPLFTGAMKVAKNNVVKRLEENNEKLILDHVYVYSGDRDPLKEVGVENRREPYFFLLSPEGDIIWSESGAFRQKYLDRIMEILSQ